MEKEKARVEYAESVEGRGKREEWRRFSAATRVNLPLPLLPLLSSSSSLLFSWAIGGLGLPFIFSLCLPALPSFKLSFHSPPSFFQ